MAAGWTEVIYNNVVIKNCLTKRFEQEIVPTDDGSDDLFHRYTVHVSGIVTGNNGAVDVIGYEGDNTGEPAGTYRGFREALADPRQYFEMRVGVTANSTGTVLLRGVPYGAGTRPAEDPGLDVNNGPRCRTISIEHIAGNTVFRVEAVFEVCVVGCPGGLMSNKTGVLSNKWTVSDEVNGDLVTTRTYQGVLRVASAYIDPNSLRGLVVPLLQPGMKREQMAFEVARDGLTIGWTVRDQEVIYAAPAPATNWHFRYDESTVDGTTMRSKVSIMMEGPRTCSRQDLVRLAAAFAYNRLVAARGVNRPNAEGGLIFDFLSVSEESGSDTSNRVYLEAAGHASVKAPANKNMPIEAALGGLENRIGRHVEAKDWGPNAPQYNPDLSPGGGVGEGVAVEGPIPRFGAFVSYLQCACCETHTIGAFAPQVKPGETSAQGERANITVRTVETVSDPLASYLSEEHSKSLYLEWQLETSYDLDEGLVAMPVAGSVVVGTSQQQTESRDSVRIISLHPPICTRTVRLAGERAGKRPELPKMVTFTDGNGIKHTRLRRIIKPSTSWRTADGQEMFRVDAEYEFALARAPEDGAELDVGSNPWDTLGLQKAKLTDAVESAGGLPDGQA